MFTSDEPASISLYLLVYLFIYFTVLKNKVVNSSVATSPPLCQLLPDMVESLFRDSAGNKAGDGGRGRGGVRGWGGGPFVGCT